MFAYTPPLKDIGFVLNDVLDAPSGLNALPAFAEVDAALMQQVIEEACRFASGILFPLNAAGDRHGCAFDNGEVQTPPGFADAYRQFCEAGWPAIVCHPEDGGQGLPHVLNCVLYEMIMHPPVQRLLMTQRAIVEGGRMLAYWTALQLDAAEHHPDAATRRVLHEQVSLITPIVKALFSDQGFQSTSLALQVFGGHGYICETGIEQYMRDIRVIWMRLRAMEASVRDEAGDPAFHKAKQETAHYYFSCLLPETRQLLAVVDACLCDADSASEPVIA